MQEKIEKFIALSLFALLARLPYRLRLTLAKTLSACLWYFGGQSKRITLINLQCCFSQLTDTERQQLARQSLLHTLMTLLEIPVVWTQSADKSLQQISAVQGKALLDDAQQRGKGVIVIAPHLGNWEYLGLFLGQYYHAVSLYQPPNRAWFEETTRKGREKTGAKLVPTDRKGVMAVVKALKAGGVTGILPDQVPGRGNGVQFAPFFGQPAATMTLIPSLLQRGNSVAVAGFAKRLPNGQFEIIFQPAPEALYQADEQQAAAALNEAVENLVKLAPEQYQWEYKRFRRSENGQKNTLY